ncbi:hypothetical protein EG68_07209 [Paragonimus skrjabini miyazakii]|uniref:Uncharacterized protein n=1 Tax=Paragonimus skrjabini miyazakii TaxID=59628 RepID=A0A8S9YZ31_9TREM|nr:hypothetical protein EG68_07209 [Paragonimus skrjabini miyazakii]
MLPLMNPTKLDAKKSDEIKENNLGRHLIRTRIVSGSTRVPGRSVAVDLPIITLKLEDQEVANKPLKSLFVKPHDRSVDFCRLTCNPRVPVAPFSSARFSEISDIVPTVGVKCPFPSPRVRNFIKENRQNVLKYPINELAATLAMLYKLSQPERRTKEHLERQYLHSVDRIMEQNSAELRKSVKKEHSKAVHDNHTRFETVVEKKRFEFTEKQAELHRRNRTARKSSQRIKQAENRLQAHSLQVVNRLIGLTSSNARSRWHADMLDSADARKIRVKELRSTEREACDGRITHHQRSKTGTFFPNLRHFHLAIPKEVKTC